MVSVSGTLSGTGEYKPDRFYNVSVSANHELKYTGTTYMNLFFLDQN